MSSGDTSRRCNDFFPFLRLPKELRLKVLEYSDLVDSRFGSLFQQCLVFNDGKLKILPRHADDELHTGRSSCKDCPHILSSSLLRVCKELHDEAYEVMFTNNLIVLESGMSANLEYLQSLPPKLCNRIRHLDIRFVEELDFADEPDVWCCNFADIPAFDRLIEYIAANLVLPRLDLTLDLLDIYQRHEYFSAAQASLKLRSFQRLAKTLPKLRETKTFHVFLPLHFAYEKAMEQTAKGRDYDSSKDGKVPIQDRNRGACHARPEPVNSVARRKELMDDGAYPDNVDDRIELYTSDCTHPDWWEGIPMPPLIPQTVPTVRGWKRPRWWSYKVWYGYEHPDGPGIG